MPKDKLTSDIIKEIIESNQGEDTITLGEFTKTLHERGFGLLMLICALPLSIPLPVPPGYTTILSVPLLFFSSQMLIGYDSPWLPNFLARRSLQRTTFANLLEKTAYFLRKLEKLTRPRFPIFNTYIGEKLYALVALLCAISIAIPLPLTNFIPAGGIALMSLGLLSRDGAIVIAGILLSFIGLAVTSIVILFGHKVVMKVLSIFY